MTGRYRASLWLARPHFGTKLIRRGGPARARDSRVVTTPRKHLMAAVLAIATLFIVVSLITDLIVGWLDPRVVDGAAT